MFINIQFVIVTLRYSVSKEDATISKFAISLHPSERISDISVLTNFFFFCPNLIDTYEIYNIFFENKIARHLFKILYVTFNRNNYNNEL